MAALIPFISSSIINVAKEDPRNQEEKRRNKKTKVAWEDTGYLYLSPRGGILQTVTCQVCGAVYEESEDEGEKLMREGNCRPLYLSVAMWKRQ